MNRLSFHQSERSNSRDSRQIVVRQSSGYHGQSTGKYIIVRQLSGRHQIAKKSVRFLIYYAAYDIESLFSLLYQNYHDDSKLGNISQLRMYLILKIWSHL